MATKANSLLISHDEKCIKSSQVVFGNQQPTYIVLKGECYTLHYAILLIALIFVPYFFCSSTILSNLFYSIYYLCTRLSTSCELGRLH